MALISALLTVAVELQWMNSRPRIHRAKIRAIDQEFQYLKSRDEIDRFLSVARTNEGEAIFLLYATAIHTGTRAGELTGLRWSDVDLSNDIITVERSYATTTKANEMRRIPIQKSFRSLLLKWKLRRLNDVVFPNERGNMLKKEAPAFESTQV